MSKRRWLLLSLAGAGLILALAVIFSVEPEPGYEGKPYSYWLDKAEGDDFGRYITGVRAQEANQWPDEFKGDVIRETKAVQAVRAIGPKALPQLLYWLEHGRFPWRDRLAPLTYKLPYTIRDNKFVSHWFINTDPSDSALFLGFELLGTNANGAVPELNRLMHVRADEYISSQAGSALAKIGPGGLMPLLAAAGNPRAECQVYALMSLGQLRRDYAGPAIPLLLQWLTSTNAEIRSDAAEVLSRWRLEPDRVLPALARALPSIEPDERFFVAEWLAKYPEYRPLARQTLADGLKHPDKNVRDIAWEDIMVAFPDETDSFKPPGP